MEQENKNTSPELAHPDSDYEDAAGKTPNEHWLNGGKHSSESVMPESGASHLTPEQRDAAKDIGELLGAKHS
jgi:hypothetical protein